MLILAGGSVPPLPYFFSFFFFFLITANAYRYFGYASSPYVLEEMRCDGYEDNLLKCVPLDTTPGGCDVYDVAGVFCHGTGKISRCRISKRTKSLIWQDRLTARYFEGFFVCFVFVLSIEPAHVHV